MHLFLLHLICFISRFFFIFFFNDTATTEIYTLSLHDALPISHRWHLTVVGDGPDRERLERLASDLRLAARVRWSGALPPEEVPKLWPELDVLVLPARGLPTWAEPAAHVVAEAMAHEVTVVGTSGGATPEVIGDA